MIASAHAEYAAPAGAYVRHREVFRKPQRMPHRRDIEAAAYLDVIGDMAEVDCFHQQVGDALVAFALEVVFRHPEGIVALLVHSDCDCVRLVEDGCQPLIGIEAVVGGRSVKAHILQVYMPCEQTAEPLNHMRASKSEVCGICRQL